MLAFFSSECIYIHIKKPGRYLLSEFYIKAINVKCKNHDALVLFYYSSMLNFHPKGKKRKHILLIPIQNLQLY